MRLIDADACLIDAWKRFYKQEDKHEKEIDDYDILRDRFYEQCGFECCQQAIVDAPTVCDIDAIRAEIEEARYGLINDGLDVALQIIDKYTKGEDE